MSSPERKGARVWKETERERERDKERNKVKIKRETMRTLDPKEHE